MYYLYFSISWFKLKLTNHLGLDKKKNYLGCTSNLLRENNSLIFFYFYIFSYFVKTSHIISISYNFLNYFRINNKKINYFRCCVFGKRINTYLCFILLGGFVWVCRRWWYLLTTLCFVERIPLLLKYPPFSTSAYHLMTCGLLFPSKITYQLFTKKDHILYKWSQELRNNPRIIEI